MASKLCFTIAIICSLLLCKKTNAQVASDYALQLEAIVQTAPPKITLNWRPISGTTVYNISRKSKTASSFSPIGSTADTFYVDATVSSDSAYEYKVNNTSTFASGAGYIYVGINAPALHDKGTLVLIVDTLFRDSCVNELNQLSQDLSGDGWAVIRHNVPRTMRDTAVKNLIKKSYAKIPDVKAVLLIGHVAVPYSGDLNPDAHPDHLGAWAADVYYGDMDGLWTDISVNDVVASRSENKNIPGDGKWDQSLLPSVAELQVSRIDVSNMPIFAKTEVSMMKNYLNKAHQYKMDSIYVSRTGIIDDNFGAFSGEAFAANAWRNFPTSVGRKNIKTLDFITSLNDSAYQWAYGCGGGSYSSCGGVGVTGDFTTKKQKGFFTMLFGSYFGDWDIANNFLRAPLCSPEPALTSCWAGRPNWFFHHMSLGENIGYSTQLTQNNSSGTYAPWGYKTSGVHVALMGDLSLRNHYIKPARNIAITQIGTAGGANISWTASPDPSVLGYYVYRTDSLYGKYSKVSGLVIGTNFKDTIGKTGLHYYMVRPSKLQSTPSGTYYNLGLGISNNANIAYPNPTSIAAVSNHLIELICFPNPSNDLVNIYTHLNVRSGAAIFNIIDANGRILIQNRHAISQNEFTISENISQLSPGIYFIQLELDHKILSTQKLIKL